MLVPGMGDNFLRGAYRVGEWNYHRSPLPTFNWSQDINSSNNALLTALNDIRQNQIPAAGFARPEFIYGWLPGNPYSGNGVAIGIPGAAAFGNTQQSKYQRCHRQPAQRLPIIQRTGTRQQMLGHVQACGRIGTTTGQRQWLQQQVHAVMEVPCGQANRQQRHHLQQQQHQASAEEAAEAGSEGGHRCFPSE